MTSGHVQGQVTAGPASQLRPVCGRVMGGRLRICARHRAGRRDGRSGAVVGRAGSRLLRSSGTITGLASRPPGPGRVRLVFGGVSSAADALSHLAVAAARAGGETAILVMPAPPRSGRGVYGDAVTRPVGRKSAGGG